MLQYEQNHCLSPRDKRIQVKQKKWQAYGLFMNQSLRISVTFGEADRVEQSAAGEKGAKDWINLPRQTKENRLTQRIVTPHVQWCLIMGKHPFGQLTLLARMDRLCAVSRSGAPLSLLCFQKLHGVFCHMPEIQEPCSWQNPSLGAVFLLDLYYSQSF